MPVPEPASDPVSGEGSSGTLLSEASVFQKSSPEQSVRPVAEQPPSPEFSEARAAQPSTTANVAPLEPTSESPPDNGAEHAPQPCTWLGLGDDPDTQAQLAEADLRKAAQALIGVTISERYRVTRLLGIGGMGCVYLAEHMLMQKAVAIKVLHRELTQHAEIVARFEREAIAAARIEHPNVVQARDFGRIDGAFFLVLDYVEGDPLGELLERELFPVERALNVVGQVAEALEAAHALGIVHRDLKPDNVMLVGRPGQPELVKVLDFGIAQVGLRDPSEMARPITRAGAVVGTPEYMSPEQAAGQRVDERSDLYAVGVLLHHMLTGKAPFSATEVGAVLMMHITQPPPELPVSVPDAVKTLVLELLEKDPNKRLGSARELVQRVVSLLGGGAPTSQGRTRTQMASHGESRTGWAQRLDASALGRGVSLGISVIPAWRLLLGAAAALLLGAVSVAVVLRPEHSVQPIPVAVVSSVPVEPSAVTKVVAAVSQEPELEKTIGLAFVGDETALASLEARDAKARSVREWLALGSGRAKLKRVGPALEAYRVALSKDASLAADPVLVRDVWEASRSPEDAEAAVRLAAEYLGKKGADLLYRVWTDTRQVTPVTRLAKQLVYAERMRAVASPALRFVLDWRAAVNCEDYQALLPTAALNADTRAVNLLNRAVHTNDCKLLPEALQSALAAAKQRPEPAAI